MMEDAEDFAEAEEIEFEDNTGSTTPSAPSATYDNLIAEFHSSGYVKDSIISI